MEVWFRWGSFSIRWCLGSKCWFSRVYNNSPFATCVNFPTVLLNLSKAEATNSSGLDLGENALWTNYGESPSLGCQIFKKNWHVLKQKKGPFAHHLGCILQQSTSRGPNAISDILTTTKTQALCIPALLPRVFLYLNSWPVRRDTQG